MVFILGLQVTSETRRHSFFRASLAVSSRRLESGVSGDGMHKKNAKKLEDREIRRIRGIILRGSFFDRKIGETVSRMTRLEVMGQLDEPIEVHLIPDVEKGEVLVDSRGQGSFQR